MTHGERTYERLSHTAKLASEGRLKPGPFIWPGLVEQVRTLTEEATTLMLVELTDKTIKEARCL